MSAAERILIVKLGALGDILLAEGAIRDVRAHHPEACISLLTRRPFAPLLARCPWVDEVLIDDNRPRWRLDAMWRLRQRLREGRFDRAYDLQNSRRSTFYLRTLLGKTPWSGHGPGCPLPHRHPAPKSLPVLQRHALQLADSGVATAHTMQPGADWMCDPVDALLESAGIAPPFVVLLPGSSARGAAKRWPHYAQLAARLHARGVPPVMVPGPDELGQFKDFPGVELRAADGRALDLYALAGVLLHASAVVGNDSGPTHLAASLRRPGLALFGTSIGQAERTCLNRNRMRTMVAPGFHGLDAEAVESALLDALRADGHATR